MARRLSVRDGEMESENEENVEMADAEDNPAANNNNQDNAAAALENNNQEEPSLLQQLLQRIRDFLGDDSNIDEEQARRLLEAGAGDLDVVTNLFLDHYFASLGNRRRRQDNENNNDESSRRRRVRRRLEEELEQHAANNQNANDDDANMNQEEQEGGNEEEQDDDPPAQDNEEEMPPPALPANRRRAAANRVQADNNNNGDDDDDENNNAEGAAVSDDEAPRVRRRRRRRPVRREAQNNNEAPLLRNISIDAAGSELEEPQIMRAPSLQRNNVSVKKEEEEEEGYEDELDEDFLSDHDWIFQGESDASPLLPPALLLWGDPASRAEAAAGDDDDNGPNVVAEDNEDDDDEDDDDSPEEPPKEGIPKTWVRAGFTPSSCGTGLVTLPPEEESVLHRLRQSQNSGSRNIAPPPYHCRGVTALLSIVTALIYSGASIQGSTVDCTAARKPFAQLSEEERKREFDTRLVDALSALLLVAAKTSLERKKRALSKRRLVSPPGNGEDEKTRQQTIERRLRLIPTCRFANDSGTGDVTLTEGQLVRIATSLTSIEDIRAYVISTLRSFTKKGGCALFLETIIRIHGKTCVDRMLHASRRKANLPVTNMLIDCECEARQKKLSQMPYGATNQPVEEPLPLDHTCISSELVSLLLTGEVHSDLKWSAGGFGIGLLTMEPGEVGRELMRPQKPVWVLRGDTCYSVAWLENEEQADSVSRGERPGTIHHWNSWFGHRNKSTMRLMTARRDWSPPVFSKVRAVVPKRKTVSEGIIARRRAQSNLVSSDDLGGKDDPASTEQGIGEDEIGRVTAHPDDEKLYPNEFRQWRFDMGHPPPENVKEEQDVKIGPASSSAKEHLHWIPYFRLEKRQQRIVDMKMSPKIKRVLWTRWPGSTIDRFTPKDDDIPPVV